MTWASAAPSLAGPTRHRFLSPHYDDIALSCGGTVAVLANSGAQMDIRVVCGNEPDPGQPLSPFARELHRRWGLTAGQVVRERQAEEAAAAAMLGASSICLSLPDAIYRGTWYQNDTQLFGPIAAAEAPLSEQIAREMADATDDQATTRLYAPLGVGNHVDHQLCFLAGLALAAAGWDVWFYEDLPYALTAHALDHRLRRISADWADLAPPVLQRRTLEPIARVDIETSWETKLAAIFAYPSQIPSVFRHIAPDGAEKPIAAALRDYAMLAGDGFPAEQFWHLGLANSGRDDA